MSGGAFDYDQYKIGGIADSIQNVIDRESDVPKGDEEYPPATIRRFIEAVMILRRAQVYAHEVDWLFSGDTGEETFEERLSHELTALDHGLNAEGQEEMLRARREIGNHTTDVLVTCGKDGDDPIYLRGSATAIAAILQRVDGLSMKDPVE